MIFKCFLKFQIGIIFSPSPNIYSLFSNYLSLISLIWTNFPTGNAWDLKRKWCWFEILRKVRIRRTNEILSLKSSYTTRGEAPRRCPWGNPTPCAKGQTGQHRRYRGSICLWSKEVVHCANRLVSSDLSGQDPPQSLRVDPHDWAEQQVRLHDELHPDGRWHRCSPKIGGNFQVWQKKPAKGVVHCQVLWHVWQRFWWCTIGPCPSYTIPLHQGQGRAKGQMVWS